ncbi:MAG: alpha/beta hydrolase [Acidimicrobiales bacterium]
MTVAAGGEPEIIEYGSHSSQYVESWRNDGAADDAPAAVLLHGGYWRAKYSCDLMHPLARHLVSHGWRVLNIEYRRIGEVDHPWLAMRDDVLAGLALWADQSFVLVGHSAGGHLALWAATAMADAEPLAVVALAPVSDLVAADELDLSEGAARELMGACPNESRGSYHAASPRQLLPLGVPQLVVHGAIDNNVPPAMSKYYAQAARNAGDEVLYMAPMDVDHFDVIDPTAAVWVEILEWMTTKGNPS